MLFVTAQRQFDSIDRALYEDNHNLVPVFERQSMRHFYTRWQRITGVWGFTIKWPAVINNHEQIACKTKQKASLNETKSIIKRKVQPKMQHQPFCFSWMNYAFKCGTFQVSGIPQRTGVRSECVSDTLLWPRIHWHLKQRLWPAGKGREKESRWSLTSLQGYLKHMKRVSMAGVHLLHRCLPLSLTALNTDIWTMSTADLASDVVCEQCNQ